MKQMKLLLLAASIVAISSAFAAKENLACSGQRYFYTGTSDPNSDPANVFAVSPNGYDCNGGVGTCTWYKNGETYIPCDLDIPGVYAAR